MASNPPKLVLRLPGDRPVNESGSLYLMAYAWYTIFDKLGDRNATYYRAVLRWCGSGKVSRDHDKACALFKKAAIKGHPLALYNMFLLLINDYGFKRDPAIAADGLRRAAEAGYEPAIINYAEALYDGIPDWGVEKDDAKALPWLERIKDKNPKYLAAIGNIYYNNKGVPRDYAKAVDYYWEAADKGYVLAWTFLGNAYGYGNGVEKNLEKAIECYVYGIREGSGTDIFERLEKLGLINNIGRLRADAQDKLVGLADAYYSGKDKLKEDKLKAFRLYQLLSPTHTRAECMEAVCIADRVVNKDRTADENRAALLTIRYLIETYPSSTSFTEGYWTMAKAAIWAEVWDDAVVYMERAVKEGCAPAMFQLGLVYLNGEHRPKDEKRAFELIKRASEAGDHDASHALGVCYMNGKGCPINYHEAIMAFFDAWNNAKNTRSAVGLAILYASGKGTKRDVPYAKSLLREVLKIDPNDEQAKEMLEKLK